jgi:hypothetical protein
MFFLKDPAKKAAHLSRFLISDGKFSVVDFITHSNGLPIRLEKKRAALLSVQYLLK